MTWHCYGYEVWPTGDIPSWPMPVAEHVTLYVRDDAHILPTVNSDQMTYRVSHNRYACVPPCKIDPRKASS